MERVACRTPTEGRDGVTNIPKWKFELLRDVILAVLADGPIQAKDLKDRISPMIPDETLAELGKLGWHMMAVKLELEVRGEIRRLPKVSPQKIMLA